MQVLKWNETQQNAFKQEAMQYFNTKFGFVDPENNTDLRTMLYSTNRAVNMRCNELTGDEHIPQEGYALLDGGWLVTVVNPNGK